MRVKLVEKLNLADYSKLLEHSVLYEDDDAIEPKSTNPIKSQALTRELLDKLKSGKIKAVQEAVDALFFPEGNDTNNEFKPYRNAIIQSILNTNTIEPRANKLIYLLNGLEKFDNLKEFTEADINQLEIYLTGDQSREFNLPLDVIDKYLIKPDNFASLRDNFRYIISVLSDYSRLSSSQLKKYVNAKGEQLNLDKVLFDNGKYKPLFEIEREISTYINADADIKEISLQAWLQEHSGWQKNDYINKLKDSINRSTQKDDIKKDLIEFLNTLFRKTDDKEILRKRDYFLKYTEVPESMEPNSYDKLTEAINKWYLQNWADLSRDLEQGISLKDYLEEKLNIKDLQAQLDKLIDIVINSTLDDDKKKNSTQIIKTLGDKSKSTVLSKVMDVVVDADADNSLEASNKIAEDIYKQLEKLINMNFISTNLKEAIAINEPNLSEAQYIDYLQTLIGNDDSQKRQLQYVWETPYLRESLLNKTVVKDSQGNLDIKSALIDFLKSGALQNFDFSLRAYLIAKGIQTPKDQINYLFKILDDANIIAPNNEQALKFKLNQLLDHRSKGNAKAYDTLMALNIINENELPLLVLNFVESSIKSNLLYTTIGEALYRTGVDNPDKQRTALGKYLLGIKDEEKRVSYLNAFKKIWEDQNKRKALLDARIKGANNSKDFKFAQAIIDFIDNM